MIYYGPYQNFELARQMLRERLVLGPQTLESLRLDGHLLGSEFVLGRAKHISTTPNGSANAPSARRAQGLVSIGNRSPALAMRGSISCPKRASPRS